MAINKKLIHFKLKSSFETELANNNLLDTSIVFIQETKEIWTHGQLYKCSDPDLSNYVKESELQELLSPIQSSLANKLEVSDLAGYAKTSDIPAVVTDSTVSNWGFIKTSDANETYAPKSLVETVSNQSTTISTLATKNELSTGLAGKLDNSAASSFVPTTRTINGTALTDNIWITATDPNAATKEELNGLATTVANKAEVSALANFATTDALSSGLSGKQETLVSGTNIKTIEGQSILGSGDIQITAAEVGAYTTGEIDAKVTALNNAISGKVDPSTVTAVSDRVSTLEGYFSTAEDSDATINKGGEIVNFLDGVAEGSNVEQLLAAKANQSALNDLSTTVNNVDAKFANYLPTSGGTIKGDTDALKITRNTNGHSAITYYNTQNGENTLLGVMGFDNEGEPSAYRASDRTWRTLLHSGNVGDYALKYYGTDMPSDVVNIVGYGKIDGGWKEYGPAISFGIANYYTQIQRKYNSNDIYVRGYWEGKYSDWKTIAFTDSTVASANALVSPAGKEMVTPFDSDSAMSFGSNVYKTFIDGNSITFRGSAYDTKMHINSSGNVTIGDSDLASSNWKLYVNGNTYYDGVLATNNVFRLYGKTNVSSDTYLDNITYSGLNIRSSSTSYMLIGSNVGIGTTNPNYKLHVEGDGYFSGQLNVSNINGYTPITSGNIGEQTVYYANSAGSATDQTARDAAATAQSTANGKWTWNASDVASVKVNNAGYADSAGSASVLNISNHGSVSNALQYMQFSGANDAGDNPTDSWAHIIKMNHENGDTYFNRTLAFDFFSNNIYTRSRIQGEASDWKTIAFTDSNVASADYATTAGSIAWDNVTGKPTIPTNTNQLTNGAGFITAASIPSSLPANGGTATNAYNDQNGSNIVNTYATKDWVSSNFNYSTDTWRPVYDGVDSSATDTSASANAVRLAYGRADSAYNLAAGKQDVISDLSTIRSQASNGNTAYSWGNHANAGYFNASNVWNNPETVTLGTAFGPTEMYNSIQGFINNGTVVVKNGTLYVMDNPSTPASTHGLDVYSDPQSYGGVFYNGQITLDLYPDRFYDVTHNPLISTLIINSISGGNNIGLISHNIVRFRPGSSAFTLTLPSGIYGANGNPIECDDPNSIYEISFIKRSGGDEITATGTKFTQA